MSELANITLTVNGRTYSLQLEPRRTLLDAIREECDLTGTHMGCEHGVCGACTVLLDGDPVRACLMFAVQAQGSAIRTVEGLADGGTLHPLQRAFMEHFAAQCGYCTPGMLMAAKALLDHNHSPTREEVVNAIAGNICRCTGYEPIINAVLAAASSGRARA